MILRLLLDDNKLLEELASVRLSESSEGDTYYLEKKKFVKVRFARSPDRADATYLARPAPILDHYKYRSKVYFHASPGRHELEWRGYLPEKEEEPGWGLKLY